MSTMQDATIRRGVRNARYSTIPNHVFEDGRLSMEARWLLGYLLSKPDNWIVRVRDIRNIGNCGRDKATSMVNELVSAGYAEKEQRRDGGKFGATVLVIYDEPRTVEEQQKQEDAETVASLPQTCLPSTAEPLTVSPLTANPTHSNNLEIANTDSYQAEKNAREGLEENSNDDPKRQKAIEKSYWNLIRQWPNLDGLPKDSWLRAWMDLDDAERDAAEQGFAAWLALLDKGGKGGKHTPRPSTYFAKKLWTSVQTTTAKDGAPVLHRPYSRPWQARLALELMAEPMQPSVPPTAFQRMELAKGGEAAERVKQERRRTYGWPAVTTILRRAETGEGVTVPPWLLKLSETFTPVRRDSALADAWRAYREALGQPPLPDKAEWLYVPAGETPAQAMESFKAAVEGAGR